jgi:glycosyltransferase involved in cell wall biosynthesis
MKVVMLCDFYNETLEYQENLLVKYYRKHGHEVTVIASTFESVFDYYNDRHDNSVPGRTYFDRGAKIIKLPYRYNILNRLRAYTRIDKILEREKPDLIYVHDIMPNFPEAIRYVKSHADCRMIMDYHADYSNSGKNWISRKILHGVLRKRILDQARPHLRAIFANTPAAMLFLHELYDVPLKDIELFPLGADLDRCAEVKAQQEGLALRRKLGIAESDIVIFTGGKLEPWKRLELLIEAVLHLPSLPLQLVVIGDSGETYGAYKESLIELARGKPSVRFTGWLSQSEIYRYLDMSDIAVFPASQSILWQQAIAMALPLIVGDIGNQDFSYLNLKKNVVVLTKDEIRSDRLAAEIGRIASDSALRHAMSAGAAQVADECLNWDKLVQRTLRFNVGSAAITGRAQL